jgi:hypothetical protein
MKQRMFSFGEQCRPHCYHPNRGDAVSLFFLCLGLKGQAAAVTESASTFLLNACTFSVSERAPVVSWGGIAAIVS